MTRAQGTGGGLETPFVDPEDELICLGHGEDLAAQHGALAPPVVQTSLFAQPSAEALAQGLAAEHENTVYTRGQNPTVEALEEKIARLERGDRCKVVASGMAAVSLILFGTLQAGDHILFVNQTYGPTLQLAARLERFGVRHSQVLSTDPADLEAAIEPATRLIWLESPGTMLFRRLEVGAVAALAKGRRILSVLDNSWATPLFQKPLTMGVDLVVHSATKYLGGHSDLVAGAVVGSDELLVRLFHDAYLLQGAAVGPWDAWLLNRGLRTLPARMRAHHGAGLAVARHLEADPRVRRVFHPGIGAAVTDPERDTLTGYSGLLSCELATEDVATLRTFVDSLERFRIGVSWGGVESLVLAPFRGDNRAALEAQGLPPGLVRLSVGLEPVSVLLDDLDRALGKAFPS